MTDGPVNNPHDVFTRQSLSHLPTACSFIQQHLPPHVVATLELSTLQLREGSFVDEDLRESLTDLLFEVALKDGGRVCVGILFEHKSYVDRFTALQLLRYMINIWERQRSDDETLCVVIPIVLYHGRARWTAATNMRQLIEAPEALAAYVPDSETCLIDLSQIPDEQLGDNLRLQVVLRILKHIFAPDLKDRLEEIMPLVEAVRRQENSLQLLETLLRYVFSGTQSVTRQDVHQIVLNSLSTDSPMPTIADELRAEGRVEGRVEGRAEGFRAALLNLIELRFPNAVEVLTARINALNSEEALATALRHATVSPSASELEDLLNNL